MKPDIQQNRAQFLHELRTTTRPKGTIQSDEQGRPVFASESDKNGVCACALMAEMFGQVNGRLSTAKAAKALGLDARTCAIIQRDFNDTPLTFPQIADRIETEIFTL